MTWLRNFAWISTEPHLGVSADAGFLWYPLYNDLARKGGEERVKKVMSKEATAKEAAYWNLMKQLVKQNPGTVCRK